MHRKRDAVIYRTSKVNVKVSPKRNSDLAAAKLDLDKIMDEIRPFIRHSRIVHDTTAGKWCDSKSLFLYCWE